MANRFFLLFLFLALFVQGLKAQDQSRNDDAILFALLQKRDYISYFNKIVELSDSAIVKSDNARLLHLGSFLKGDFESMDLQQRQLLRSTSTYIGQKIWRYSGDFDEALAMYLIAHQYVENKTTLDSLAWYIENQIAVFYTMQGDFEKADYFSNLVRQSLKHYQLNDLLSRYYTNLGRKLKSEYKIDEAIEIFELGLHLADSIEYANGIFSNSINLAEVYNDYPHLGSPEPYLKKAEEFIELLVHDRKYLEKKSSLLMEMARFNTYQGNFTGSIPLYKESISTLNQYFVNSDRREFARFYTKLAKAYLNASFTDSAVWAIDQGLKSLIPEFVSGDGFPSLIQLYPENSFIELLELKSLVYVKLYDRSLNAEYLKKSLLGIEQALHVNDLIRESVIGDPSKLITIHSNKELTERAISILYDLYELSDDPELLITGRNYFNRSKSILYNENIKKKSIIGSLSVNDHKRWIILHNKVLDLYKMKFDSVENINEINGEILLYQSEIEQLFSKYKVIDPKIFKPADYIEYVITDEKIYSFSELNGQIQFKELGTQIKFQELLSRLNEFLHLRSFSLDESVLNELYEFLILPITPELPPHIVFIPDGVIGFVPFEMLIDKKGDYLLQSSTISYAFEYETYLNEFPNPPKPFDVFCLAPEYKVKPATEKEATRGPIYSLPYAKTEAEAIARLFGQKALNSYSGDKLQWRSNISDARIFHYAGHAVVSYDNAYLALSSSEDAKQHLTSEELQLLDLTLDLVVLSACETGLGKMDHGEGIRSLGRAFMESGTKATVISLWNVNDKSTSEIMSGFYKNLLKGFRKDEALRYSKLDYLKSAPAKLKHPFFWAAFIPAGDMGPLSK